MNALCRATGKGNLRKARGRSPNGKTASVESEIFRVGRGTQQTPLTTAAT
jgi:hypothetical protein